MNNKNLKISLIFLTISSCSGISFIQFDNAPEASKKLPSSNLMLEGIYQVNDIRNEEMNIVNEKFYNNEFNNYQNPNIKNTSTDTISYFLKIFLSEEFMEIKKTGNAFKINAFNAINKNIYNKFGAYVKDDYDHWVKWNTYNGQVDEQRLILVNEWFKHFIVTN